MKREEMQKVMIMNLAKEVQDGNGVWWLDQEDVKEQFFDVFDIKIDGYIRELVIHRDYIAGIMKKTLHDITLKKFEYQFYPEQIEKFVQKLKL